MATEEALLKTPYNLKVWLRHLERKQDADFETRVFFYERALKELPGSYKLWKMYLGMRRQHLEGLKHGGPAMLDHERQLNHCYERALVFLHKVSIQPLFSRRHRLIHLCHTDASHLVGFL